MVFRWLYIPNEQKIHIFKRFVESKNQHELNVIKNRFKWIRKYDELLAKYIRKQSEEESNVTSKQIVNLSISKESITHSIICS